MEHLYSYQPQVATELRAVGASAMPSMRATMKKKKTKSSKADPVLPSQSRPFHTGKVRGQDTGELKRLTRAVDTWNRNMKDQDAMRRSSSKTQPVKTKTGVPQQMAPRFGKSTSTPGVSQQQPKVPLSTCAHATSKRGLTLKPEELVCLDTVILFELIRMDALVVHEGMVFIQRKRVSNVTTQKTENNRFDLILDEIAHSVCMHSHRSGSPIFYVPYIPTSMKLSQMNPYMKVITREGVKDTKKRLSSLSTMTKRSTIRERFLREIGISTITSDIPQYNIFESKWRQKVIHELEYVGRESWSKRQEQLYEHLSVSV